jgi:hypothetical protein
MDCLLGGHYPSVVAPTGSCASLDELSSASVCSLVRGVFAGCLPVPAARRTFPTLLPEDLSYDAWAPITTVCGVHVPVSSPATSAYPTGEWVGFLL